MRFRAAVLPRVGEPLRIEAVDVETLAPDVLIRNRASGPCHTDLEVMQGSQMYPLPICLDKFQAHRAAREIGATPKRAIRNIDRSNAGLLP
jgi:Zn-dependent alcohol dehydrogenase